MCRDAGLVFLNGILLGTHRQADQLCASFRHLRRSGRVGEFVSIYLQQECCYIASDGGRWASLTSAWAGESHAPFSSQPLHLQQLWAVHQQLSCFKVPVEG